MDSKLPLYHWLVVLVPGSIFLAAAYFILNGFGITIPTYSLGESETVRAFIFLAVALFVGELLQAIGGLVEPLLFWSWGGSASKKIMNNEKYRGEKKLLQAYFGEDLTNEKLFEVTMAYSNQHGLGRSEYFNTLYAYSRSLFIAVTLLLIGSLLFSCNHTETSLFWWIISIETLLTALLWNRTKKRGSVFVKEVVLQTAIALKEK